MFYSKVTEYQPINQEIQKIIPYSTTKYSKMNISQTKSKLPSAKSNSEKQESKKGHIYNHEVPSISSGLFFQFFHSFCYHYEYKEK